MTWLALAAYTWASPASAVDNETITVRTHDGSVYRGEFVERVTGDHVTLRVVTGSLRRIAWREVEIDPAPPPPEIPVVETVRTTDGSVYRGEIVEKVIGDHVAVKTATGAIRFVLWRELDTQPAHDPSGDDAPQPAALTVHTGDGSVYHGEIVEKVNGDHVTLKIATGALRRIEWSDIDANPKPRARMPLASAMPCARKTATSIKERSSRRSKTITSRSSLRPARSSGSIGTTSSRRLHQLR